MEQRKRAQSKRTKIEKLTKDLRQPQEITEADIQRSENETTKNVANVSRQSYKRLGLENPQLIRLGEFSKTLGR